MKDFSTLTLPVTDSLILKTPTSDDAQKIFELISTNREHLSRYLNWVEKTTTPLYTYHFIERCLTLAKQGLRLPLYLNFQGTLCGFVSVTIDPWHRKGEIGYWIANHYSRQGLMTRSVQALISYLFSEKILYRLEILCAVSNAASIKIPKKLGFQLEGRCQGGVLTQRGYEDAYLFGVVNPLEI